MPSSSSIEGAAQRPGAAKVPWAGFIRNGRITHVWWSGKGCLNRSIKVGLNPYRRGAAFQMRIPGPGVKSFLSDGLCGAVRSGVLGSPHTNVPVRTRKAKPVAREVFIFDVVAKKTASANS